MQSEGKGRLLHIADFETGPPTRILRTLHQYWDSLRKGEAVPARADVDPRGIRSALDHAFILERIAPGAARFRLAGRHLIDLMGMEVRGMPICSLLHTGSRGRFSDVLESVFRGPQIAQLALSAPSSYARPPLRGLLLLLPLRSDLGDVTRALGCLVAEGSVGQTPRRFELKGERLSPTGPGARVIEPSPAPPSEAAGPWRSAGQRGPAGPDRPLAAEATPEERRALFRIISGRPHGDAPCP